MCVRSRGPWCHFMVQTFQLETLQRRLQIFHKPSGSTDFRTPFGSRHQLPQIRLRWVSAIVFLMAYPNAIEVERYMCKGKIFRLIFRRYLAASGSVHSATSAASNWRDSVSSSVSASGSSHCYLVYATLSRSVMGAWLCKLSWSVLHVFVFSRSSENM